MKLLQLIKDFRKWREEKYENALELAIQTEMDQYEWLTTRRWSEYEMACYYVRYGIKHRKEILKKVKI